MPFPDIDPVLIQIGPFAIRWYALAYICGIVFGWLYARALLKSQRLWGGPAPISLVQIDDFILWVTLGIILGGRTGYVLFYKPGFYLEHPLAALTLWEGGMSFHGGLLGGIAAILLFATRNRTDPFMLSDLVAIVAPLGLFFGRLANFINGELWGRTAPDVPWAMVFPAGGPMPRHPSQLNPLSPSNRLRSGISNSSASRSSRAVAPASVVGCAAAPAAAGAGCSASCRPVSAGWAAGASVGCTPTTVIRKVCTGDTTAPVSLFASRCACFFAFSASRESFVIPRSIWRRPRRSALPRRLSRRISSRISAISSR